MKLTILISLFFLTTSIFAQQDADDKNDSKNELRLNVPATLASFPEITYERILNDESSLGFSLGMSVNSDIDYDFLAVPFYRLYFGNKRAAGFFVEPNVAVFSEERNDEVVGSEIGLGAGLAIGGKFLTRKGWVVELLGGMGRNFLNTDYISDIYPRIGVSIGKRF